METKVKNSITTQAGTQLYTGLLFDLYRQPKKDIQMMAIIPNNVKFIDKQINKYNRTNTRTILKNNDFFILSDYLNY